MAASRHDEALLVGRVVLHLAVDHHAAAAVAHLLDDRLAQSTSSTGGVKTFLAIVDLHRVQRPGADAAEQERRAELVLAGDRVLDVAEGAVVGVDAVGGAGVDHARQRVVPRVLLRGDARRVLVVGSGSVRTR